MQIVTTLVAIAFGIVGTVIAQADDLARQVDSALARAGDNRGQIERALERTPDAQQPGIRFLVAYMPLRDLQSLSAEMLLDNVRLAYLARETAPWGDLPEEVFLNYLLPYANVTEERDNWRGDFHRKFLPLIEKAETRSEAAALLNQKIFPILNVRYSTKRSQADQGPQESIDSGLASCTGLSILLIDACRAVGIPARFVGTPLWTNKSGNHSWVEIWDGEWRYTGAAEPAGLELDNAWFTSRAATAQRDHPLHAIYAVSYKRTPLPFPLVWDRNADYVFATNVTDRYTQQARDLPAGQVEIMFRAIDGALGERRAAPLKVFDRSGNIVFDGVTKDERCDANDHLATPLRSGEEYRVELQYDGRTVTETITADQRDTPITLQLHAPPSELEDANDTAPQTAVQQLEAYLKVDIQHREPLADTLFAQIPLTINDAELARALLWQDYVATLRQSRGAEMEARALAVDDLTMPFFYQTFGDKPDGGRSMYISLHGGGGTTPEVNDRQWQNQQQLYSIDEGVYVAPRAPTNTWNLWHQEHIDKLFDRLIANMIVLEDVNPDRVYLLGYSAGGDGVYQLAPRMADRWAAAAMMAGHPNDASPLGLRNIGFTLHVGGLDSAYQRNQVAGQWEQTLGDLHAGDPTGYDFLAKIYSDKGHWMDHEDASAIAWMAQHVRNPYPSRIVWKQDDVVHTRFYWLAVRNADAISGTEIRAEIDGQDINIHSDSLPALKIRLTDDMLRLDRPVRITWNDHLAFHGIVPRTIEVLATTLAERGDRRGMFAAELELLADNPEK